MKSPLRSNKRLKLTEPAVDEYAAREFAGLAMTIGYVRATGYTHLAECRRSLAAIR